MGIKRGRDFDDNSFWLAMDGHWTTGGKERSGSDSDPEMGGGYMFAGMAPPSDDHDSYEGIFPSSQSSTMSSSGEASQASSAIKRAQHSRITTEAHQKTVAMMMEASRELWSKQQQRDTFQKATEEEQLPDQLMQQNMTGCCLHYQKPYW